MRNPFSLITMKNNKLNTRERILIATWHLMEHRRGKEVHMRDIAQAVGISRQALYLHFKTRTELMIATVHYVDEVKGLNEGLKHLQAAKNGIELLEICIDVWGNHIPEIYGLAKTLISTRETDKSAAAAWDDCMSCLHDTCQEIIETLDRDGILIQNWTQKEAIEMLWTQISIQNWEQLTVEHGWSTDRYVSWMKEILKRIFVDDTRMKR